MSTGEDEPSPNLNGRLRPRKSTSTTTPAPQNKTIKKPEGKLAQDRPKRTSTPSKASPAKQDDLVTKSDTAPAPLFLCPYCDRKFNARQTVSKHARRIHLSTSKQDNFIKCLYCNHSDAESNAIIKHMVDSHPNQYFACLDCHTRFLSTTELAEHKHNVCEKQKPTYRSKLRQNTSPGVKKNSKKSIKNDKAANSNESTQLTDDLSFNGIVISCELKPSDMHDAVDIEDKITTNLILPSSKALGNAAVEKSAVIVLDDLQWNKRIPPNFSFHNSDADQILSRLGVVHRSPRVGESRKDLIRMMDEPNEKFEKCFDTGFYTKVARNVQENLAKYLDGSFNFNPNRDTTIKTRKSKASVMINTAEGFPILLAHEQFSRNLFDGFITRTMAPKHKWKWDTAENDKNVVMLLDQTKRDNHTNSCIITLISSLDIWTQLRMKSKFEEIFKTTPTAKKTEKQNIISMELKEILESRDIPSSSSQVVQYKKKPVESSLGAELPAYLGLSAASSVCELQPAVLSGEWVRPRCYVCCACGDQTRDARTLSAHLATRHPNAQVQHYEIVGETLLSADILKHLYVPPSQMSNRTRPPRGFRDCTKCNKSITLEDLHQHMLDCAGDTPTVRRKCRYRPFGVRRRRPRLPDNTIRKKMRKDMRSRHRQKSHMRPRPRARTEVGDAETIRKMIADLPAKRNRITPANAIRPRRTVLNTKKPVKHRPSEDLKSKRRPVRGLKKPPNKTDVTKKQNDTDNSSTIDEDDQPLKLSATRVLTRTSSSKGVLRRRATINRTKKKKQNEKQDSTMEGLPPNYYNYNRPPDEINSEILYHNTFDLEGVVQYQLSSNMSRDALLRPTALRHDAYPPYQSNEHLYGFPYQASTEQDMHNNSAFEQMHRDNVNSYRDPLNQPELESSNQWIDVKNAGPSNIRQHSSRDDNNMQSERSDKDQSVGGGNRTNQNNNIAQTPNTPLKHSIASLTSDTEARDAATSYHNTYVLPSEINTTIVHESVDSRTVFEYEATVEKVDKPPLSSNQLQSKRMIEQQTIHADARSHNAYTSTPCDLTVFRNPTVPSLFPKASDQRHLQMDSIGLRRCVRQLSLSEKFKESQKSAEDSVLKNSIESSTFNREHKLQSNIEIDKTKSSKIRKGLNDCIAMLRTKKGLRLEKATIEHGEDDNTESEIIDLETVDSELPVSTGSERSLSANKAIEERDKRSAKLALTDSFPNHDEEARKMIEDRDFSASKGRNLLNDRLPGQAGCTDIQQKKLPIDSEHVSLNPKQHESAFDLTKSSTKQQITSKPVERNRTVSSDISVCSKYSVDDNSDSNIPEKMKCHSNTEIAVQEQLKPFFYHRVHKRNKPLTDDNTSSLTHAMFDAQSKFIRRKEGDIDLELSHKSSHRIVDEVEKRKTTPESAAMTNKAVSTKVQAVSNLTTSSEGSIDSKLSSQLSNVSPVPRRTRRKPIKNKSDFGQQSQNEQIIPQNPSVVTPLSHDSQGIGTSPVDSNIHLYNPSYMTAVSPSQDMLLKTPPPLAPPNPVQVRRESCKRVLSGSEPFSPTVIDVKRDVSPNKMFRNSSEAHAESIIKMHNLRRQSIELANAQSMTANYENIMAQAYREHYEKTLMSLSQNSRAIANPRNISPDDCFNDSSSYEEANELHNRYSSKSTFVSMTHDTHGIMHVNPKSFSSNVNAISSRETHEKYKTNYDNEQFMSIHRQRSDNYDTRGSTRSSSRDSTKVAENLDRYSSHVSKAMQLKSNALDNNSHALKSRKTSEVHYNRSSPYQRNIPNKSTLDHSLEMGFAGNSEMRDNALHAYHKSVASFAMPSFAKNLMHLQHNTASLMPPLSCEPNLEEIAPLDLSCDSKSRKDETLDLSKKTLDVSRNTPNNSISIEKYLDGVSGNTNFRHNYNEQLRSLPQISVSSEIETIEDLVHKLPSNVILQESGKNNNPEISKQNISYRPISTCSSAQSDCASTEIDRSIKDSSKNINYEDESTILTTNTGIANIYSTNQLQSLALESNYIVPPSQTLNSKVYHKDKDETTFENEKISQAAVQANPEPFDVESLSRIPCAPTNANTEEYMDETHTPGSYLHMEQYKTSSKVNDMDSENNSIREIISEEKDVQASNSEEVLENDITQTEQDAETARKIAMLPEELVKILGTIPKDHRNQLLNVLPQYVSTPISNVDNDTKNMLPNVQKHLESRADYKGNSFASSDSNRLTINTASSPVSVIPKKRHSPSHSKGRLNSNELLSTEPTMPPSLPSTMSQHSLIECNESANNLKGSQTENLINTNDSVTMNSPTCKTTEKDRTEIKENDVSESIHSNKNNEVSAEDIIAIPKTLQDVGLKPPIKQKSNEQTASLRAVRIKTTSTKKSFADDKKLLTNYCYLTNVTVDEKFSNTRQIISPGDQACNVNATDSKYDNAKLSLNNQTIEANYEGNMILNDAVRQNTDCPQERSKTTETIIIDDTMVENSDYLTQSLIHTRISLSENDIILPPSQDCDQSKKIISLEEPLTLPLQNNNRPVEPFLEQMKSTTFSRNSVDEVSGIESSKNSPGNESNNESVVHFDDNQNDCIPEVNVDQVPEENIDIIENKTPVKCSDDTNIKELLSSTLIKKCDEVHLQNKALKDDTCNTSLVPSLEPENKNVLIKNDQLLEDESDDDISLAIIKQKHCKEDSIKKDNTTKQARVSDKSKSKDKKNQCKLKTKRQQRKARSVEIVEENKPSDDVASNDKFPNIVNRETKIDKDGDEKITNIRDVRPVTEGICKTYETDVIFNNDIVKNKNNKTKKSDDNLTLGSNIISNIPENSFDENEQKDTSNNNVGTDKNLMLNKDTKSDKKEMQNLTDLKVSRNVEYDKLQISARENQSKSKKTKGNKSEIKCDDPDVNKKSELDMHSSIINKSKQDKKEVKNATKVSKKDSTKLTPIATQIDILPSDFQLCSEISEVNTLPLRRSRRGKSMYVDSGYLEDMDKIEDRADRAPLTMKRLILSRVEKDNKRISESSVLEKTTEDADDHLSITSEEPDSPSVKKGKQTKRKKSPHLKRVSKKVKSTATFDYEDELSDLSNSNSTSESNSCILRELPNAENKITEIDSCSDDMKGRAIPDNTTSLSENTTIESNEIESNVSEEALTEIKDSTSSVKRKLNNSKSSDTDSSKSKKTKYQKKKSQSDFDSDDDKVLVETKQLIATEKHSLDDNESCNITEEKDNNGKSPKHSIASDDLQQQQRQTTNSASSETRVTCYSRPISNRRPRSSSSFKEPANYDPYDIDFIDILETTGPIVKKKGKNTGNRQYAKLRHVQSLNVSTEDINESPLEKSKQTDKKIKQNINIESDSDSSKSDVPLQRYVDEKSSKMDMKNKNSKEFTECSEKRDELASNKKCLDIEPTINTHNNNYDNDEKTCSNLSNIEEPSTSYKSKKSSKRTTTNSICESDTPMKDDNLNISNNVSGEQATQKQTNKQKKTRRVPSESITNSAVVLNEEDQQLRSDKFMENFGFYSERMPRKSNLLASKKISETFHNMISNESDDSLLCYKEKTKKSHSSESKKKSGPGSNIITPQDLTSVAECVTNLDIHSAEPKSDVCLSEPGDVVRMDDSDLDSITAQAIMDSEEVRSLENDLFSSLREAAEASAARNSFVSYQSTSDVEMTGKDVTQKDSVSPMEDKISENLESAKKSSKTKSNKQPGVKELMYPDIEEIDMFEDKFDKIKRKRRSQAVAAKQVQVVAETNSSAKPRKQSEKKRNTKSTKKNYQNTQIPTKGALKGFEGIKISIPTQDLHMPINVSPPSRQPKKRRKTNTKRRKEASDFESSCSDFEDKDRSGMERDIYEFKDSEDTELFDLRPSTVMDRFRSMLNKNKVKNKEKDKSRDTEKEKLRSKEKERKVEGKDVINFETVKERDKNTLNENRKGQRSNFPREETRRNEKNAQKETNYGEKNLEETMDEDAKLQKGSHAGSNQDDYNCNKEADNAIASTSGFIPNRMDESDYESEMSSPEGDFIFYMSNDTNCVCPSDNDSDDSDVERGCGRLNCVNKNRNADKNAAIENIFKNNAVRCEKPEIKEPEKPRPNLDQLFDSLLETETKTKKDDIPEDQKDQSNINQKNTSTSVARHNLVDSKDGSRISSLNKDIISMFDEGPKTTNFHQSLSTSSKYESKNLKTTQSQNELSPSKPNYTSTLCQNDILTDSGSMQMFSVDDDKQKESIGYSLMSEESTQVNFMDIIAHEAASKSETNVKTRKPVSSNQQKNYNSEDEFDIDKPETLNRQYMHLILPAEKASTCVQTDNRIDDSDVESGNESAASKYLKGLSPSEAAKMEIYTMVSAQSTQTGKSKDDDSKSEDETDVRGFPRSRIRLQKYDVRDNARKSRSTKSIQTERNNSYKSLQYDAQTESDDEVESDKCDRIDKEPDKVKGNKSNRGSNSVIHDDATPPGDVDAFTAPPSRVKTDKHSPRKSDEGISTSYDYSADAFDQSFDEAGVARQRARRKCTVGKQNVLAEHWSSESEFDGAPPRPNSADSVVASAPRKKKSRKKEGHHTSGKKTSRHLSKSESKSARGRTASGGRSEESDASAVGTSGTRAPPGPKIRARAAHHYWSSEGEEPPGPQPQHGWIVGDSHKKLVTMLAHAKGRKRNNADRHLD